MRFSLGLASILLSATSFALPTPESDSVIAAIARAASAPTPSASPSIVKISAPTPPADAVFVEPPPLFDPPEPRPDPLFENGIPVEQANKANVLHEPAMPTDRKEVLLPFDGAHVHPENTPYTPEEGPPGSCGSSIRCVWLRSCLEIGSTLVGVSLFIWAIALLVARTVQGIYRTATSRNRSPSGSFRPEPEVVRKDEKNPLLKQWQASHAQEKSEKKVSFAV